MTLSWRSIPLLLNLVTYNNEQGEKKQKWQSATSEAKQKKAQWIPACFLSWITLSGRFWLSYHENDYGEAHVKKTENSSQ